MFSYLWSRIIFPNKPFVSHVYSYPLAFTPFSPLNVFVFIASGKEYRVDKETKKVVDCPFEFQSLGIMEIRRQEENSFGTRCDELGKS